MPGEPRFGNKKNLSLIRRGRTPLKRSTVVRSNECAGAIPHFGPDALTAKYLKSHSELEGLHVLQQACKFAVVVDSDDIRIPRNILMLISVQADCPTSALPDTDIFPEGALR